MDKLVEFGRDKLNSVLENRINKLVDKTRGLGHDKYNSVHENRLNKLAEYYSHKLGRNKLNSNSERIILSKLVDSSHKLGRDKSYSILSNRINKLVDKTHGIGHDQLLSTRELHKYRVNIIL